MVLGFVLAWALPIPVSGGKQDSDFTQGYKTPVKINSTIPNVKKYPWVYDIFTQTIHLL